jgi:hypothetical protein
VCGWGFGSDKITHLLALARAVSTVPTTRTSVSSLQDERWAYRCLSSFFHFIPYFGPPYGQNDDNREWHGSKFASLCLTTIARF